MSGFQPISYGEAVPDVNVNINTDELLQRLINVQTYSSLILNNLGVAVDTSITLPEFAYNGAVSQTGYNLSYGTSIMICGRNYDFEIGLDLNGVTTQNYLQICFRFNNETYTVYPEYSNNGYFYKAGSYNCPVDVYVADKAIISPNYIASPGHCGLKFILNKTQRAPINVLSIGTVKTKWTVPAY